jgi:hypothetical protein
MTKVSDLPTLVDQTEVTESFSSTLTNFDGSLLLLLEQAASPRLNKIEVIAAKRIMGRHINDLLQHLI